MSEAAVVLKPRGAFDRRLARIEQQVVWEHAAQSVRDDVAAIERCVELADAAYAIGFPPADRTQPSDAQKLRALAVVERFISLAHTIRKETLQDRTIPTLARVEASALLAALPPSEDERAEAAAAPTEDGAEAYRRAVVEALRAMATARSPLGLVRAIDAEEGGDRADGGA